MVEDPGEIRVLTRVVSCLRHIRQGDDIEDADFLAICLMISRIPSDMLLQIVFDPREPEVIAAELLEQLPEGTEDDVDPTAEGDGTEGA